MKKTFALLLCLAYISVAFVGHVAAFDNQYGVNCNDSLNAKSSVCASPSQHTDPLVGPNGLLANIANIVAYVAGAAAIIIIIIGAIRYITSSGDSNKVTSAKDTIFGAIIGLVIIILARQLIFFVVGKL
jgi:hypothetical protein